MSEHKRPWRDYYDSEYLTGDALPDEGRTFLIIGKSRDEVEGHDGAREHKLALEFSDGNRFLVNITNASYMAHMFGSPYPADWVGRRVTLAFDPTIMFGKERVGGIRVIGSPDITEPVTFTFQENSRRKPRQVTLVPTRAEEVSAASPHPVDNPVDNSYEDPVDNSEDDELSLVLGEPTPLRPSVLTSTQLATITRLSKGLYEAELMGILDGYGATSAKELTKKDAEYVIAALKERGA